MDNPINNGGIFILYISYNNIEAIKPKAAEIITRRNNLISVQQS